MEKKTVKIEEIRQIVKTFLSIEQQTRQILRVTISKYLEETSEEHPLNVNIQIDLDTAVGLSSLEMPRITRLWKHPSKDLIYAEEYGYDSAINIDEYSIREQMQILEGLEENRSSNPSET